MPNVSDKSATGKATTYAARLTPQVAAFMNQSREKLLPVWVRAPARGPEFFSGFSRAKLYELHGKGKIRSVSIREPGAVRGTRLFELKSITDYIEQCEQAIGPARDIGTPE